MPLPLLTTLSAAARAASPIIRAGVAQGLSKNAIARTVKAGGFKIRRTTLLTYVDALKGIERANVQLRFLRLDRVPNIARLPEALTPLFRDYSFLVEVRGVHIASGENIIQHISVSLDAPTTRSEIERMAVEAAMANQKKYEIEVTSSQLIEGLTAGPAGLL